MSNCKSFASISCLNVCKPFRLHNFFPLKYMYDNKTLNIWGHVNMHDNYYLRPVSTRSKSVKKYETIYCISTDKTQHNPYHNVSVLSEIRCTSSCMLIITSCGCTIRTNCSNEDVWKLCHRAHRTSSTDHKDVPHLLQMTRLASKTSQYKPEGCATVVTNDSFGIKNKPVQTRRTCHTCYKWLVWHQKKASTNQKDVPHLLQMTRLTSETSQYKPEGLATLATNDSFGIRNKPVQTRRMCHTCYKWLVWQQEP